MTRSRLAARVDRAADLWYPQRNVVVIEDRESQAVLVAVEGTVRFADHHGVEPAIQALEFGEQRGCLRAALPRDGAGLVYVEELRHDYAATRLDEGTGSGDLPGPGAAPG